MLKQLQIKVVAGGYLIESMNEDMLVQQQVCTDPREVLAIVERLLLGDAARVAVEAEEILGEAE